MADNEVNKKQINWIMIAAAIGVTAIIGVVGVFAARTIQEKNIHDQKNKQLLDMYKAYIEVLNDNESDIKAYHKNSFAGDGKELEYRLSNNSVKYPCCLLLIPRILPKIRSSSYRSSYRLPHPA